MKPAVSVAALHQIGVLAVGGKEHDLTLWDVNAGKTVFTARNVANSTLDLRVPVWVTSAQFLHDGEGGSSSPHLLAIATAYKQVRCYDARAQRRPVRSMDLGDHPFTATALAPDGRSLLVGDTIGTLHRVDLATMRQTGVYQGMGGSIRAISVWGGASQPLVACAGLDRSVTVHHIETRQLLRRIYLKQRLTALAFEPVPRSAAASAASNDISGAMAGEELDAERIDSHHIRFTSVAAAEKRGADADGLGDDDDVWEELQRREMSSTAAAAPGRATGAALSSSSSASVSSPIPLDVKGKSRKTAPEEAKSAVGGLKRKNEAAAPAAAAAESDTGDADDFADDDDVDDSFDDDDDDDDDNDDSDDSGLNSDDDGDDDENGEDSPDDALVDSKSAAKALLRQVEDKRRTADKDRRRSAAAAGVRPGLKQPQQQKKKRAR